MTGEGPSAPQPESVESPVVARALEVALKIIKEEFEEGDIENRLAFHDQEHTKGVVRRAGVIARAMGLPAREVLLAQVASAFHDVVQEWKEDKRDTGAVMRSRLAGDNERKSAEKALNWMKNESGEVFTEAEYARVWSAIMATVPDWDPTYATVKQVDIVPGVHPITRALALSDLGAAGMEPAISHHEGLALFTEENLDIVRALRASEGKLETIPEADQERYKNRYATYLTNQVAFIRGRQARLEVELEGLPEPALTQVRALFSHFDTSIQQAEAEAAAAPSLTFDEIARRLTPEAFSQ